MKASKRKTLFWNKNLIDLKDCCYSEDTEEGRFYITNSGNRYPSITTILSATSDKTGLIEWRNRVGEKEADKISRIAAENGTIVHEIIEKYLNDGVLPETKNPFSRIAVNKLLTLLSKIDNIHYQELPIFSDKLKIGGRVDCIAEFDGKLSVIDFKTSRSVKKREWITNYFIQTAFYAAAYYERTGIAIDQSVILMTIEDHEPALFIENTFKWLPKLIEIRRKFDVIR